MTPNLKLHTLNAHDWPFLPAPDQSLRKWNTEFTMWLCSDGDNENPLPINDCVWAAALQKSVCSNWGHRWRSYKFDSLSVNQHVADYYTRHRHLKALFECGFSIIKWSQRHNGSIKLVITACQNFTDGPRCCSLCVYCTCYFHWALLEQLPAVYGSQITWLGGRHASLFCMFIWWSVLAAQWNMASDIVFVRVGSGHGKLPHQDNKFRSWHAWECDYGSHRGKWGPWEHCWPPDSIT